MKEATVKQTAKDVKSKTIRPENKDEMDSRKKEEWDAKGDDAAHHTKQTKADKTGGKTGK